MEHRYRLASLARVIFIAAIQLLAVMALLGRAEPAATEGIAVNALGLPPGFVDEVFADGLLAPRAMAFAPDGSLYIAERGSDFTTDINFASIRWFKDGALVSTRTATFEVCGDGERGLLGLGLDPDFAGNGFMYVYYTRWSQEGSGLPTCAYYTYSNTLPGPRNIVARITVSNGVVVSGSHVTLIDNIASDSGIHNAGDLHFGADDYLYISTGDSNLNPSPAQYTNTLMGKILRIKPLPDGSYSTAGNPFDAAADAQLCGTVPPPPGNGPCREVFAYGFRNPFRFDIQPGTSTPFAGDVGGGRWEEIDEVTAGADYGWPSREGPCSAGVICDPPEPPPPGFTNPIYAYPHNGQTCGSDAAVIAGTFYSGTQFPAQYLGSFFFADFVCGFIRRISYDSPSGTWSASGFGTGGDGIIGIRQGPDGALYYVAFISDNARDSQIRRIRYDPGVNQPPNAHLSANPLSGPLDTVYTFSGIGSADPDNNLPLTYAWDLGDGVLTTTTSPTITHSYSTAMNATITLTVTDSGAPPASSAPVTVTVYPANEAPTATIALTNTTDALRAGYYAGDVWQFGVATAGDDESLPAIPFTWSVVFHHRNHTHPFLSGLSGAGGQFSPPLISETDPLVWYRVYLYVTDARGQTTAVYRDVFPITTTVTLRTVPAGGSVILEGGVYSSPLTVTRVVHLNIGISVPSPQTIVGVAHVFRSWSNGGSQAQAIAVPPSPTVFTATLMLPHALHLPIIVR